MFKRFLLFTMILPAVTTITSDISACSWNLQPTVLLLTSYQQAQNQNSYDQLVYQKLQALYGKKQVATLFSTQDDNYYAITLRNYLTSYNIKKVFILNASFQKYMPHSSKTDSVFSNNLIRVLQQFQDVKFYFFNNIIADNIKVNNNIYDIRYNSNNVSSSDLDYGTQLANYFINNVQLGIKHKKYNFDVDNNGKAIVRIGIINNIGIAYEQTILNQFVNVITATNDQKITYQIMDVDGHDSFATSNIYSTDSISAVGHLAHTLYETNDVNFIINSNAWYNNIIAYTASVISSLPTYSKTISFVGCDIVKQDDYYYNHNNYLAFGFMTGLAIFDETVNNEINPHFKIIPTAPESNIQTYGINTINFTN